MKKLLATLLMLIILISALATPVLAAGPSLQTATGGGTVERTRWGTEETYRNTYTFTVQQLDKVGNAKGHFVVIFSHGTEYHHSKIEADIRYAYFEGNAIYMSGVITQCYRPQAIGKGIIFGAQDNGEGLQATGLDKVSSVCSGVPIDAATSEDHRNRDVGHPAYWLELTNGNIQIK